MTAETEVLGHDVPGREQTNEEKVLAFIADRPDGCSSFAISIETRIQRGAVVQGTRNKKGIITWYPSGKKDTKPALGPPAPPELPKPAPIAEEDEEAAAWKRMTAEEEPAEDEKQRARCPVDGCGAMIIADREHMGGHLNHKHGNLQPRDRAVMLDRMYPRPRSPSLEDLKAEMEEDEAETKTEADRLAGYMEKVDKGEISKPPAGSNMDTDTYAGPVRWPEKGAKLPKRPGRPKGKTKAKAERAADTERIDCPIEGCTSRPIRNKQNVRAHLRTFHKLPLVEIHARLEQVFGAQEGEASNDVQPNAPEPAAEPVQDVQAAPVYTELPTESPTEELTTTQEAAAGILLTAFVDRGIIEKPEELAEVPEAVESLLGAVVNDRPGPEPETLGDLVEDIDKEVDRVIKEKAEALPSCATCADDQCGDRGKDQEACAEHEPECGEACSIRLTPELKAKLDSGEIVPCSDARVQPDPVLDAPFAAYPIRPRAEKAAELPASYHIPIAVVVNDPAPFGYTGRMINELPPFIVPPPRHIDSDPKELIADVQGAINKCGGKLPWWGERPKDPLAELVRTHRVRVGREISKLKKVERKLRRRAAAAEAMADRVKAARRTKEKELDRFERELAEVEGVSL